MLRTAVVGTAFCCWIRKVCKKLLVEFKNDHWSQLAENLDFGTKIFIVQTSLVEIFHSFAGEIMGIGTKLFENRKNGSMS